MVQIFLLLIYTIFSHSSQDFPDATEFLFKEVPASIVLAVFDQSMYGMYLFCSIK